VNDVEANFTGITKEFNELKISCLTSHLQVNNRKYSRSIYLFILFIESKRAKRLLSLQCVITNTLQLSVQKF